MYGAIAKAGLPPISTPSRRRPEARQGQIPTRLLRRIIAHIAMTTLAVIARGNEAIPMERAVVTSWCVT